MKKIFFRTTNALLALVLIGLTTASICGVVFAGYINKYILPKADVDIAGLSLNLTSHIYYTDSETGKVVELQSLHGEQNRIYATIDTIPENLVNAFVSIEDERFYEHNGVDWKRTILAAVNWVIPMKADFGGSTITQQLVKNVTEDNDYSVTRKITEIMRAISLDKNLEKDQILELYMNTIYLGRGAYGVNTAAMTYFGKELSELNIAECALIAGITKNPSYFDPFSYPENAKGRQETILYQMFTLGKITEAEYNVAKAYELVYLKNDYEQKLETSQSYFVDALVEDIISDLMVEYGYSSKIASQLLYTGGFEIYATIDVGIQEIMENVYEDDSNFPSITGKDGEQPQSSMVIIDPYTGHIKGIVGGRGEKVGDRVLNRASQSLRQPGSAIKPIGVYAPAFDLGVISPITVIEDSPFNFTVSSSGWPTNSYTGYRGQVTVLDAVADSVNTIAVKLLNEITPQASFNFVSSNLNVDTLVESQTYSDGSVKTDITLSSLSLGGLTYGMTAVDIAKSYVPFVNEGYYIEPTTYTHVLDSTGKVILQNETIKEQVFKNESTVFYMRRVLEEVLISGTATSAKIPNMDTLGKTGTTSDNYDRWFVGATPYYVGATWFGYDNPQAVRNVSGNPAQTVWTNIMKQIHEELEPAKFEDPTNFRWVSYCKDSGLLPCEYCSQDVRGSRVGSMLLAVEDIPTETCNLHVQVPIDTTTGGIATVYCPIESVKNIVLLDLTRLADKAVALNDQVYTVTYDNPPVYNGVGNEDSAVPVTRPAGGTYTGEICTEHDHFPGSLLDPEDPDYVPPLEPGGSVVLRPLGQEEVVVPEIDLDLEDLLEEEDDENDEDGEHSEDTEFVPPLDFDQAIEPEEEPEEQPEEETEVNPDVELEEAESETELEEETADTDVFEEDENDSI